MSKCEKKKEVQRDLHIRPRDENATVGQNTPEIAPPAFNPPVPNRAWTEMKKEIEDKSK